MNGPIILLGLLSAFAVGAYLGFLWGRGYEKAASDDNKNLDDSAWSEREVKSDLLKDRPVPQVSGNIVGYLRERQSGPADGASVTAHRLRKRWN